MAVSKRFLKLIIFCLTLPKRALSSAIFSKLIIIVTSLLMPAKYDTSFFTKDQKVHSDLHHDSNSELTWISKIKQTNSMIIFKKHVFLLVISMWEQVKSGCSHLIQDGLTLYLGFGGGGGGTGGVLPRKKNRKLRSSKLLEKHWDCQS